MSDVEDLVVKIPTVRCFQTVREVWEDVSASKRSGRRMLSIVKRINCSMLQSVVAYTVPFKHSFQNEKVGGPRQRYG